MSSLKLVRNLDLNDHDNCDTLWLHAPSIDHIIGVLAYIAFAGATITPAAFANWLSLTEN